MRWQVGLPQQRLFEASVIWEHLERPSGRVTNSEPEIPIQIKLKYAQISSKMENY